MSNRNTEHDPQPAPELDNTELLEALFGEPKPTELTKAADDDDIDWQRILDSI